MLYKQRKAEKQADEENYISRHISLFMEKHITKKTLLVLVKNNVGSSENKTLYFIQNWVDIVCNYLQAAAVQILYATTCKQWVYRYCMQLLTNCKCSDIVINMWLLANCEWTYIVCNYFQAVSLPILYAITCKLWMYIMSYVTNCKPWVYVILYATACKLLTYIICNYLQAVNVHILYICNYLQAVNVHTLYIILCNHLQAVHAHILYATTCKLSVPN